MDYTTVDIEFLRPLVTGWLAKLESAAAKRKDWKVVADECMTFYANSAQAMWDPKYQKKFWKNVKLPRFRLTVNKAFEMVAVFGPNLFWEIPHRTVEAKAAMDIPPEFFGQDPQMQQMFQQVMMQQQQSDVQDKIVQFLMDRWLNYTPREQPGGGLGGHSMRGVIDGLIKGRGCSATRPYQMPGSTRNLTGSFRVAPEDIYLDPDFDSVDDCRWMAIKHIDVHSEVEKRFSLPKDSLQGRATLESTWQHGELSTDEGISSQRKSGATNDLVIWYEIFSKTGVGVRKTNMDSTLRNHLDDVVGQYAYIAVSAGVPYPLNMPSEGMRKGASDEEVRDNFSWPIPYWADDSWPVEFLDFYENPESAWPVPPMAPGLGELKLLNFLISWFANRTWSSSRDFWAVAQPYLDHYKDYINNGEDQMIIPTPVGLKSPKEAIEILTQPEGRRDMTQLIEFVSDMFDKRVGLTPTIYGQNEGGTQNRTAEETVSKTRAVMARPEYMQKQVVEWQSRIAQAEALVTRWFVTSEDVLQLLGPAGAMLWKQHIESTDVELVTRQFQYTISASSIRRPNRDRDIANYQQVMNQFAPVLSQYGMQTNNFQPWNGMVNEWGRLHDVTLDEIMIPQEEPDPEAEAMQQQAQQLELQKLQAEVGKINADAQAKMVEAQIKPQEMQAQMEQQQADLQMQMQSEQMKQQGAMQLLQAKMQAEQMKQQGSMAAEQLKQQGLAVKNRLEMLKSGSEMQSDKTRSEVEMLQDAQRHYQEMDQDEERHDQEMEQARDRGELELKLKSRMVKSSANGNAANGSAK